LQTKYRSDPTVTTPEVTMGVVLADAGGTLPCAAFVLGAAVPALGSGLAAGVMLSTMMPSPPLTVPRLPTTAYVPVSPLENLASVSATEASALSEAFNSYRFPSTISSGRLNVPVLAAVPVKVSLSTADDLLVRTVPGWRARSMDNSSRYPTTVLP
jgi:hypothetical protein